MRSAVPLALALVSAAAVSVPVGDPSPDDAEVFLKQNGLETHHEFCVDYLTQIAHGKPETAASLYIDASPPGIHPETGEQFRVLAARMSGFLAGLRADDIELVAAHEISSKAKILCYVLNSDNGPFLVAMHAFQREETWYSHGLDYEARPKEIAIYLRGAARFRSPPSRSIRRLDDRTT